MKDNEAFPEHVRILVIIVSYNFERWMAACLDSLRASAQPVSVLVVDNHSTDRTVARIKTEYPEVQLIENKENLGFGAANNIGFRKAIQEKYNSVFLLNQDAWIDKHVIGELSLLHAQHPQYGIWSPVHLDGEGAEPDHGFTSYSGITHTDQLPTDVEFIECSFINAAFWFIPVSVLHTVGGFSPLFYHYGEDKDFTNRLKYHQYRIAYSPRVFGYHDRKERKATPAAFFRSEEVYLMSEYANINYSFRNAFSYGVLAGIKKSIEALVQGKWSDCITYLSITSRLIKKTSYIRRIRKETMCKRANYIQP